MTYKKMRTLFFTLCLLACFFFPSVSARAASPLENSTTNCLELLKSLQEKDSGMFTSLEPQEMKNMELTDDQYQTISNYTKTLTENCKKDAEKIEAIFKFARFGKAVAEAPACPPGMNPNSPYLMFKTREGVCQGFAYLCRTMFASLGIPSVTVHGYLTQTSEGHAWNYVYYDGDWILVDAAYRDNLITDHSEISSLYATTDIEKTLYTEDGLEFSFCEGVLGVIGYSGGSKEMVVPESCHGLTVAAISPLNKYAGHPFTDSSVERIVLPKTVEYGILPTHLDGSSNEVRFFKSPFLKEIEVAEDNPAYASYKGILYDKSFSRILSVPWAITDVELKPLKVLDKETFNSLSPLENPVKIRTIKIAEGTETIDGVPFGDFALLESVYIPASVTSIDDGSFSQCSTDLIIYAPEGSAGAAFAVSKGLTLKDPAALEPADYTKVDAALKEVPADLSKYTDETVQKLQAAIEAVDRDLTAEDQDKVDRAASAILDAINALDEKSTGQPAAPPQDPTDNKKPETPATETPATEKPALQDPPANPPAPVKVPTLKKVTGLRVSYKKSGKAVLIWKKVKGATGYEIRRLQKGKWVRVKAPKKTNLSIKRNAKKTYQYKVRAYKKIGKKMYYGAYSKKIKIRKM